MDTIACIPSLVFWLYLDLDLRWAHITQARVFLSDGDEIDTSGVDDAAGTTAVMVGRCVGGSISRDWCVLNAGVLTISGQHFFINGECYDALDCLVQVSVAGDVYR